jgi:hypothetical protein
MRMRRLRRWGLTTLTAACLVVGQAGPAAAEAVSCYDNGHADLRLNVCVHRVGDQIWVEGYASQHASTVVVTLDGRRHGVWDRIARTEGTGGGRLSIPAESVSDLKSSGYGGFRGCVSASDGVSFVNGCAPGYVPFE